MASTLSRFINKVAVCTGSTQGIGFATAKRLGEEGAKVVVSSRKQDNVIEAVEKLRGMGINASGVVCHQAKKEDRLRLFEHAVSTFGGIDLLFASAGVNPHTGNMLDITENQWDKIFDVNVKSVFMLIREVLPYMENRGGGAIVTNSTSMAYIPEIKLATMVASYAVSKLVQISMVKVLADPCSDINVRINAIAPGSVRTPFYFGAVKSRQDSAEEVAAKVTKILKRSAEPEECAGVVAFLLSKDASFISGDCVTVCGGYSNRL